MGVFRALLVTAGLGVIACVSALVTMHFAIHGAEVAIPDLRGLTVASARQKGALAGLNLRVDGKLYSTTLGPGRVLTQSPAPGTVVRRDWTMRVVESLGPELARIPNVLGEGERLASIDVRRAGLELGTVARMPDPLVAPGTVLAQDPAPDAAGVEQPAVELLVASSEARDSAAWVMPEWRGSAVSVAQEALARAGLPPAVVHAAGEPAPGEARATTDVPPVATPVVPGRVGNAGGVAPGTIVGQSPAPGERLAAATTVTLEIER